MSLLHLNVRKYLLLTYKIILIVSIVCRSACLVYLSVMDHLNTLFITSLCFIYLYTFCLYKCFFVSPQTLRQFPERFLSTHVSSCAYLCKFILFCNIKYYSRKCFFHFVCDNVSIYKILCK